ncbi:hypothetical protein [Embleya sp. NPDC001921]
MEMSVLSTQWIKCDLTGPDTAAATAARFAFTSGGRPATGDWHTAEIVDNTARLLVGPDGHTLTLGTHKLWVEITAPPETITETTGLVVIT